MRENYDFFSLPLLARENSIVAIGANDQTPEYDYTDGLTLNVFSLKDKAEATVCDMYGNEALKAKAVNEGGKVTITVEGTYKNLKVCMRNVCEVKNLTGAVAECGDKGVILKVTDGTVTFEI